MSCSCKGTAPVGKGYGKDNMMEEKGEKLFSSPKRKLTVTKKATKKSTRMTFAKK